MSEPFKALALGTLRMKDAMMESRATQHCLESIAAYRSKMGWEGNGCYRYGSWLWKRWAASRMFEGDFSFRIIPGTLFGVSNLSMNMPKDFIDAHNNQSSDDMLGGDEFMDAHPEGPEDTDPAIGRFGRYIQRRGKLVGLREKLKEAKKGAFIRGECFVKTTRKRAVETAKRDVRLVMQPTGEPAYDSRGCYITEDDVWVPMQGNPAKQCLQRDPRVSWPADVPLIYSEDRRQVMAATESSGGADVGVVYFGDIVFDPTKDTLQDNFVAHIYEMTPDKVLDMLPPAFRTPEAEEWYKRKTKNGAAPALRSDMAADVLARGEDKPDANIDTSMTFAPVLLAECYLTADLDGDGRPERVCYLLDLNDQTPIIYEYTHEVMPWAPRKSNPFTVIRINPITMRVYGIGYYDELADMNEYCDKNTNRIEVEIAKSGNLLFENKSATQEGVAGLPLKFRTLQTYKLNGDNGGQPPVTVVTVVPQTTEIENTLDRTLQRLQTAKGTVTPANAESAGLDAANTLGGLEILQRTSDTQLKAREEELMVGTNEVLEAFTQIEAGSMDWDLAAKLFRPVLKAAEARAADPNQDTVEAVDPVEDLKRWILENADNIPQRVRTVLSRETPAQIIEQSTKVDETMAAWFVMPPEVQKVMKETYARRLRALGEDNPDAMLITLKQPVMPEQQPAPNAA